MNSFWESSFIVVDVETTGSDPEKNKITDIACILVQGGEIVDVYASLVNPHQFIPHFISNMTGITNEMAFNAPEASEIFKEVSKFFNVPNPIFVAHNVNFDWSFVQRSFVREGLTPLEMPKLCTLKLSRRLLPKDDKKNVGALAEFYGINIKNRHRALGDAEATALILLELLEKVQEEHEITSIDDLLHFQNRPVKAYTLKQDSVEKHRNIIESIPDEPGVYYFYDKNGNNIYIGKAKSLKSRVQSYFRNGNLTSRKVADMVRKIETIKWECSGNELSALVLESREIKRVQPKYNVLEKRYLKYPFIKITADINYPRVHICNEVENDGASYYGPFKNYSFVNTIISIIDKKFGLRKCEINLENSNVKPCFYADIDRCIAPCTDACTPQDYAVEVDKVKTYLSNFKNGVLTDLEKEMIRLSEDLDFENAAKIRDQIHEIEKVMANKPESNAATGTNNMVFIMPADYREKTIDIFLIVEGKLAKQTTLGRKAPLDDLFEDIHHFYFNGNQTDKTITMYDIDEIRIVNSWIFKNIDFGISCFVESTNEDDFIQEVESSIRQISFN